ncbi:hypothetical protein pb186bvf_007746 [Paramecium bursaria]
MERAFFLNGRPLINPPLTVEQQLDMRLEGNGYQLKDILKLDEKPKMQLIDTEGLNANMVSKHPTYQKLLKLVMDWNEKVLLNRLGNIQLDQPLINDRLFRNLRNQLQEVQMTRNRQLQMQMLQNTHQWYLSNLTKSQLIQEPETGPLQFQYHDYPEQMYHSSVTDYFDHYRSQHREIEPPEDRVKDYKRKNLISDASTRPGTVPQMMAVSQVTRPQTSQTTYKMIEHLQVSNRPKTNQFSSNKPPSSFIHETQFPVYETFEEQKTTRRNLFREQSPLKAEKPEVLPEQDEQEQEEGEVQEDQDQGEGDALQSQPTLELGPQQEIKPATLKRSKKKKKGSSNKYLSIAPEFKNYQSDKQTEEAYHIGQRSRLGEYQSTYIHHDPTTMEDKMAIARLQQIYIQNRNKELKEIKEDDEMIKQMQEWALNKGRVEEMIVHKGYVSSIGSQFTKVGYQFNKFMNQSVNQTPVVDTQIIPTQVEEEVEDFQSKQVNLENKINKQKLDILKKQRGSWLPGGVKQSPALDLVLQRKQQSSSSFRTGIPLRPFSSVFKSQSVKSHSLKQVNEVNDVKSRLASAQKIVPANILQRSLVIPQGHKDPKIIPLPVPGLMLDSDPEFGKKNVRRSKKKK